MKRAIYQIDKPSIYQNNSVIQALKRTKAVAAENP